MPRVGLLYLIMIASGIAGLGYQMVWSRLLSVSLGHEMIAVIAVVSAFFIGLTAGALTLGPYIRRSMRPQLWFIALECTIACWALTLTVLIPVYNQWLPSWIGVEPSLLQHWGTAFSASFLLLLPATAAMGATLPAMERVMSTLLGKTDRVAGLYAGNTFGAVLGTLVTTFYLVPLLGLTHTLQLLAVINLVCGIGVWFLCRRKEDFIHIAPAQRKSVPHQATQAIGGNRPGTILFVTGLLGIGYEILVIRVLSQVLENTIFTFAVVLSVYLLGTAMGSAIYQRTWATQQMTAEQWRARTDTLLVSVSTACLLGVATLWFASAVYLRVWQGMGRGFVPAVLGELVTAVTVFLLPTMLMGALFSHLAQRATHSIGLGKALGLNSLGAAVAPLLFGIFLLPAIGAKLALLVLCAVYLLFVARERTQRQHAWLLPVALIIALAIIPLQLRFVDVLDNEYVIHNREGVMATLAVVEGQDAHRYLKVNNHFTMGGTASRYSDHRQTHIPLLMHDDPRSVLYLGIGTGITLDAARYHRHVAVTGVELIPETLPLMHYFGTDPESADWQQPPKLVVADARRYVLSTRQQFDVIIGEIYHPARDGAAYLYTVEHFTAVRSRLSDSGVFCQWLPLFQLDLPTLKTIIRSFLHVFPSTRLHLGHNSLQQPILCLEGAVQLRQYPANWLSDRVHDRALQHQLVNLRLNSDFALFGGYLGSSKALRRFVGEGPLNTDDHPVVNFQAPLLAYDDEEPPVQRLVTIVRSLSGARESIVSPAFATDMDRYWQARDQFLLSAAQMDQYAPEDRAARLVSELLGVVSISGDFEPAYFTLLAIAQELYGTNPGASYQLLQDLHTASPEHSEALLMRNQLFPARAVDQPNQD